MAVNENCVETMLFGKVCDSCSGSSIYTILAQVFTILTFVIGALAVIGIIICGVMYLTSGGDPARQTKARTRFGEVLIGILCYGLLYAIVSFLIPGNFFTTSDAGQCPKQHKVLEKPDDNGSGGGGGDSNGGKNGGKQGDGSDDDDNGGNDGIDLATLGLTGEKAPYFMSNPVMACPKNTKHTDAGTMIDYTTGEHAGFSFVNTPIDVIKYTEYLNANHISMDNQTCKTNGECKKSDYYNDDGNCEKFATIHAGNLNGNACVSNDAFAGHMGKTNKGVFSPGLYIRHNREPGSGNYNDVPARVNKAVVDPRLNLKSDNMRSTVYPDSSSAFYSTCDASRKILSELVDHGRPVVVRIRGGTGHWAAAVGIKTSVKEQYLAKKGSCGGVPQLSGQELVFLNSNSKIYHDQAKYWSGFNYSGGVIRMMLCGSSCSN